MAGGNAMKRMALTIGGGTVLVVGIALLVLPGPGLVLVLAGLLMLASVFPRLERFIDPVRDRAMKAAEVSVSSPLLIAWSVFAGLGLIAAGIVWGVVDWLPKWLLPGWGTGSGLILSGILLFGLLAWSYRRVRSQRAGATSS